jgi:hypothetical protein
MTGMSNRLRQALKGTIPLFAVQIFLALLNLAINVMSGSNTFWAIFPILAMSIPQMIIFGYALMSESPEEKRARKNAPQRLATSLDQTLPTESVAGLDAALAAHVTRTKQYQKEVLRLAKSSNNPVRTERLNQLVKQFDGWTKDVEKMAERVQSMRLNDLVLQDLKTVPESIRTLAGRLVNETDPRVKQTLEQTLIARQGQLQALEKLQSTARHAEVQLENTVASLGTIYSQALANQSTSHVADYQHLASDVDERVRVLRDELAAIEEVRLDRRSEALKTR